MTDQEILGRIDGKIRRWKRSFWSTYRDLGCSCDGSVDSENAIRHTDKCYYHQISDLRKREPFKRKMYQPFLPFKPRIRPSKIRSGVMQRFLQSDWFSNGKMAMTTDQVGYRTSTGAIVMFCPFHPEKTPSFRIQKTRNVPHWYYHCFGCGKTGSLARLGHYMRSKGLRWSQKNLHIVESHGTFHAIKGGLTGAPPPPIIDSEITSYYNPGVGMRPHPCRTLPPFHYEPHEDIPF